MNIKQAVILAGGRGTRLRPITDKIPKPMVEFHGKPFLEYLIDDLKSEGLEEVVLLTGYLSNKIQDYFGDGSEFGLKIKYSVGDLDWDTGKRVKEAEHLLEDKFLLMYGDNSWPLDMKELSAFYKDKNKNNNTLMSVTVFSNKRNSTKNNMLINDEGLVTIYDKKRETPNLSGVDIGFFIVDKSVVKDMSTDNVSLQETLLKLVEEKKLAGYLTNHKYYSVGDIQRLPITEKYLNPNRKIIFLDRYGVINKKAPKSDYVKNWTEFEFLLGTIDSMKKLKERGYEMYIVSNQAGIARMKMSESDVEDIHNKMRFVLKENNADVNGIYYCPHGWDDGCECRKPKPGMFFNAAEDNQFNLYKTIFVGDDERDKVAGDAANIKTILVSPEVGLAQAMDEILKNE